PVPRIRTAICRETVGARGTHVTSASDAAWPRPAAATGSRPADGRVRSRNVRLILGIRALADRCGGRAVARARKTKVPLGYRDAVRVGLTRLVVVGRLNELHVGIRAGDRVHGALTVDAGPVEATRDEGFSRHRRS